MLKHSETKNSEELLSTLGLRGQSKASVVSSHGKQWLWMKGHLSGANDICRQSSNCKISAHKGEGE